ncbi:MULTISPECIES: hypothetical protein [Brevibacillus]|uniref:Uncharacterized protein n=1 Tax=Brevibacillus brevis TaxID=1393 RepID=A0A2Z4MKM9_BREBE|nr:MULTISPECIES: hypothetical protein [Brevibacillus]AWX57035.1 hypothetical protein AB432_019145 [Brevibacillus brevis]NRR20885.1 hypothetical protein [Brevibacillus sp. MS2.2]
MTEPMVSDEQELIRQYILFGILFRAVMADLGQMRIVPLKFSYQMMFEELSRWAERQHHQLRRILRQRGCTVVSSRRQGHMYVVHYRQRGYVREAIYTIEVLRAECQELVHLWTRYEQRGENKR